MSDRTPTLDGSILWRFVLVVLWSISTRVHADCECGYSYSINSTSYTVTDLLESDFLHVADISLNTDWRRQEYNVTAQLARGPYGESFQISQVMSNPLTIPLNYSGPSMLGGDPGLQLYVRGGVPGDGLVPVAGLNSVRQDMIWGSYRAGMKLSDIPGTCAAFFWVSSNRASVFLCTYALTVSQSHSSNWH
jgi:hypothetical protein